MAASHIRSVGRCMPYPENPSGAGLMFHESTSAYRRLYAPVDYVCVAAHTARSLSVDRVTIVDSLKFCAFRGGLMKRVLLIGFDPATVDYSDPALPPGMTAEKIHAGVKLALADFAERGWHPEVCFINPDETAVPTVER